MKNLPIQGEVVNVDALVKGCSRKKIFEKLQRCFNLVNEFIHEQHSENPEKVVWIKKDREDPDLLKIGFRKKSKSKNYPKVKINFETSYFKDEKVRIIKCTITNALKEWKNGTESSVSKEQVSFSLKEKDYKIIFE